MNLKQKQIFLLILLAILLFTINYSSLDKTLENFLTEYDTGIVERVIDGDTIVINQTSIRLLGINSPERGEPNYEQAKKFLEKLVLNKTVKLEYGENKYDKYKRILAYIHINNQNVNLELVKEGFANFYFPFVKDIYYNEFKQAWEDCIKKNKNLCEKSENKCADCIELKEFNYKEQEIIFNNKCNFYCELTNWEIKDEGRKNFIFSKFILKQDRDVWIKIGEGEDKENILFWTGEDYVWTKTGDTLFLRDNKRKLVIWKNY